MSNDVEQTLIAAQVIVDQLIKGSVIESFGVMNQTLFIDFRDDNLDDNRLIINCFVELNTYSKPESMDGVEYVLLCISKCNLLTVITVECSQNQELTLHFSNGFILSILPDKGNIEGDQWQLNSSLNVAEGGKSVIALVGGGYATW